MPQYFLINLLLYCVCVCCTSVSLCISVGIKKCLRVSVANKGFFSNFSMNSRESITWEGMAHFTEIFNSIFQEIKSVSGEFDLHDKV